MTEQSVGVVIRRGRPLAPMQRPLWASQRRHPDAPLQNMALLSRFEGAIDAERLATAFARVVEASDALRTQVAEEQGVARVVLRRTPVSSEVVDLPAVDVREWAEQRARRAIDPTTCAYDSVVLRHEDGAVSWYLAMHHAITDATSSALVFAATAVAYAGDAPVLASYYDWASGLEERGGARFDQAAAHWRDRPRAAGLGRLYRQVRTPTPSAERVVLPLPSDVLDSAAARLGTDYAMVSTDLAWTTLLVTLAAVHVHRVARADEFSIGLPVHNRGDARARTLVGPVMEVFPVDIEIVDGDTFRTLHRRVGRAVMRTLRHAVPGAAPAADYEAVVNVIPRTGLTRFGDVPVVTHWIHSGAADATHLLRLQLTGYGDGPLELVLDLNEAAAGPDHRRRAGEHALRLLRGLIDDPDASIESVVMGTVDEMVALERWETAPDLSGPTKGVVELLAERLAGNPAIVLQDGERGWSGAELWSAVLDTAHSLKDRGVGRSTRVGIELPRSAEAVIATLATMVAGGSYVPLDPCQPIGRRRRLAERAQCRLVLTELPARRAVRATAGPVALAVPEPDDEAYLLFTSGSSGEPKGVPITHRGLARYVRFASESYAVEGRPFVAPLFSALTFDLTVTSLFVPLVSGGRLVVVGEDGVAALTALARRTDITWCKATPSHLEILERLLPPDHQLSVLVVGGEAFGAGLARRLAARRPGIRIFNEYGPTEAVVGCMIHETSLAELEGETEVPIGRPAPGVTLRVVDRALNRVTIGTPGELLIAHPGLTVGYLDGDDGPFVELDGQRFYRSGDLVRLADDATLVYLGRIDEQVKVGGIRLEPTEVEAAIAAHPAIRRAAVRLWTPTHRPAERHCVRCGLPSNVPGVRYDGDGVCDTCRQYERIAPLVASWFKTTDDLRAIRDEARRSRTGAYDCVALLSGGKDSTYALYQLVAHGFEPFALTLDNGFLSDQAKENIRRTVADLGVAHEFATTPAMNAIFNDSLERYSNVCNGCFKTIYTVATNRAVELGAPLVITGLSRGQLFETRLAPQQFTADRFDPEAIDRAVLEARRNYHRVDDAPNRLLDTRVFADDAVFERIQYVDFYRYVDVQLSEMLSFLELNAPWVRPTDTGRSTNCRINDIGIHTHLLEQGFHNYAVPYAWDVRLGHKVREVAMEELDDRLDQLEVDEMLAVVGYRPAPRQVLTAWFELHPGERTPPSPGELRAFLGHTLPSHAIPAAFVVVPELPMTTNGKLDTRALPAPERVHRSSPALYVSPVSSLESMIVTAWERILHLEPIGLDDDFFNIGGDSLAAIEMAVMLSERLGQTVREELAFLHTTPRALAAALEAGEPADRPGGATPGPPNTDWTSPPALTVGEQSILFDQQRHPESLRYNVGHLFRVEGSIDTTGFVDALRAAAARHLPLSWSYGVPRRPLAPEQAVHVEIGGAACAPDSLADIVNAFHRVPFDLDTGPLLRVLVQPVSDGSTAVTLSLHHVCGDAESFMQLWDQANELANGRQLQPLLTDTVAYSDWLRAGLRASDRDHWRADPDQQPVARLAIVPRLPAPADGFLRKTARFGADALRVGAGASAFSLALAALAATLRRYSDGDDIGLGVIASNRSHPASAPLVGYLLNTLPVHLAVPDDVTLRSLTSHASATVAGLLAHRAYPLADIVADRRVAGTSEPVIDVLLAFHELRSGRLGPHRVTHEVLFNGEAVADATFFVELHDDRVDLAMEYRGTVMTEDDAVRLLGDFEAMLRASIETPSASVGAVPLPSDGGGRLDGGPPLGGDSVLEIIESNIVACADRPAVVCGEISVTWAALGRDSDRVARALVALGVVPGDRVVVCLPRSAALITAVLGVLRAGATYVPVDPTYPQDRIRLIAAGSGARVSLVEDAGVGLTPTTLTLSHFDGPESTAVAAAARPTPAGDHGAYLIFTSGSTGTPRGVLVDHRRLATSTAARTAVYDRHPGRFLLLSSIAFDSSVAGLFWTLAHGGQLVVPTDAEVHDPDALLRLIGEHCVSHTLLVPTLYEALLERGAAATWWPSVVVVAGEVCPARLAARHHELRSDSVLVNEYGPTEATVWATVHRCAPFEDPVPIGTPIPGTWVDVVDRAGRSVPEGVAGELRIGGVGVADGYVNDPEATARRFGRTPSGGRFFDTGDRVTVRDGRVVFLGRLDHQLNVGGVRAEPEEIERVLGADPTVGAVIVTATDPRSLDQLIPLASLEVLRAAMASGATADDPLGSMTARLRERLPASPRLVAHLEPRGVEAVDIAAVAARARASLPPLLRPSVLVAHPKLPRTPNGKLDRDAAALLPTRPARAGQEIGAPPVRSGVAPADGLLEIVKREFRLVLGRDEVGDDDSFFDLGGHSLLALEVVQRLEERTGRRVTVATLYDAPTPAVLASRLHRWGAEAEQYEFLIPIQPEGTKPPIFGIHVLGQNAAFFRPLSARLGQDQPVFGLGLAGGLAESTAPTEVTEVCRRYAEELERCSPSGPLVLAAVSIGSIAAIEVARQLVDRGREVVALVLFDAAGPDADRYAPTGSLRLRMHLRLVRRDPLEYVRQRAVNQWAVVQWRVEQAELLVRTKLRRRIPDRLRVRRFVEQNIESARRVELGTYDGRVIVFRAGDEPFTELIAAHGMGWNSVFPGGVEVVTVPGGHLTMLQEPHVAHLADHLRF